MTIFSDIKDFKQLINSSKFYVDYDVLFSLSQEGLKTDDYLEIDDIHDEGDDEDEDPGISRYDANKDGLLSHVCSL